MEEAQRNQQYSYHAISNLVYDAERGPRKHEPTGEAESLWGRKGEIKMGDRIAKERTEELEKHVQKAKSKRQRKQHDLEEGRKKQKGGLFIGGGDTSILKAATGVEAVQYRPKTKETQAAYEDLLTLIRSKLGDQPYEYLAGAADEVLAITKDENLQAPSKKAEVEGLLNKMSDEDYKKFYDTSERITDFQAAEEGHAELDEDGVAVVWDEEDDDEDDSVVDEIDDSDSDADGVETDQKMRLGAGRLADDDAAEEQQEGVLRAAEIDAYWLQRKLSEFYPEATVAQQVATDVLQVLQLNDEREVENKLVLLLEHDKFDFIKLLLTNRAKVMFVTRLRRAQSDEEREAIQTEMQNEPSGQGAAVLAELQKTKSSEKWAQERTGAITSGVRREAQQLRKKFDKDDGDDADDVVQYNQDPFAGVDLSGTQPSRNINLDSLTFNQGSHLMSNKRCDIPNAWSYTHKGYEEIHVPATKSRPPEGGERLIPIAELPQWAQPAFEGMETLNRVQSQLHDTALQSAENVLLCAPTGAGKTNVAMLTMLHEIGLHVRSDGSVDTSKFKIVYVAPMKALVQEVVMNFSKRLAPFNITVRELSGDQNLTKQQISETQVIVTTPEKWDIITRKSGDRTYTQLVRLLIIDEIHLLHDSRGPVLEAIVARTIRQIETTQEMIRIVGLSATLPNFEDVAAFLRVKPEKGLFFFDSSFRPCPLQQQYIGVTEKKPFKRFQLMNEIAFKKVEEQAGRNQVIVFVHSRKETAKTARALRDLAVDNDVLDKFIKEGSATREILADEAENVGNQDLKEILPYGFAIHHAGMSRSDRSTVEDLFADGHVQVLCSTATLAWGVNLPAHTVIIKGTQIYSPEEGRWTELSPLDVMQMLGRAGRPQYDTSGEGIIITTHNELQYYLSLLNQQLPIESQMVSRLADILNAEIVLGSVNSVEEGATWLGYTYLYVRMLQNPSLYGVSEVDMKTDPTLLQRRVDLMHAAASLLEKHNLIKYDRKSGILQSTALGRVASYYYIAHPSISTYNELLKPNMSDIELIRLFSLSHEFRNIVVRQEEKQELAKLIQSVPIPIKESMEDASAKVNVLFQAYVSQMKLDGFALIADMVYVQQSAARIFRALFEIALRRGWAALALKTLDFCKMVDRRLWRSQSPLRQFKKLDDIVLRKLERNDFSWERYFDLKPAAFGEMVRVPKLGKIIHKLVHQFPKLELTAHVQPITRQTLKFDLILAPDFVYDIDVHGPAESFWVFVEDVDGEKLLHYELFNLRGRFAQEEATVSFTVSLTEPFPPQYFVRVVSDRWLHASSLLPVSFRHLILPEKYPPHTELLDLQPIPVTALADKDFQSLYDFKVFNPIQTQTFGVVYESDDSCFIGAPPGSDKLVCAELAMLRLFKQNPDATVVYVDPVQQVCRQRFSRWSGSFADKLGKHVVELTGETAADLRLLTNAHIVIATPEQWDVLSRRWKLRKAVQDVSLFIVEDMHLVGGNKGPTLEVVTSRMRYMSSQLEKPIRIVALSASLANGRDIGDWMGVPSHAMFNFHPQVRPVPLEIRIQGYDINHFASRLLAMARPTYAAIKNFAARHEKPSLVFVPSRKQAQLTAIDLITYAAADDEPNMFLGCEVDEIKGAISAVSDVALKHTLQRGVAFYHDGMMESQKQLVRELYLAGAIRAVVATSTMCWGLDLYAHLVVIMDTQSYDGRENRYVDYPIADVLQMMGYASRPGVDDNGRCVLGCHTSRREYLKKFLFEPLPVESHLDHFLHDHMNAEITTKTIENKQEAVDYLTWTLFYRRLPQNPNYYNLHGVTHRHLSDHLSELIETVLADLAESKCIAIEDDMDLSALNLGMIAAYYNIRYTTIELFASSVTEKTKIKGILNIISNAAEFEDIPIRHHEDRTLRARAAHCPVAMPQDASYSSVATKVNILLQCHFSRTPLPADLRADLHIVLERLPALLLALVDVISSLGFLKPALAVMDMSQMVVQALWSKDSELLQIPHFTTTLAKKCEATVKPKSEDDEDDDEDDEEETVERVPDIRDLPDAFREELLGMDRRQMSDVARFCNRYPDIDVNFEVVGGNEAEADSIVTLAVSFEREELTEGMDEGAGIGAVHAPYFPVAKSEGWWVVIADPTNNAMLAVKRVSIAKQAETKLQFAAPETLGERSFQLLFVCDSYLGCDQEFDFDLDIKPASMSEDEEASDDE